MWPGPKKMKARFSSIAVVIFVIVIFIIRFCILEGPPLRYFAHLSSSNDTLSRGTSSSAEPDLQESTNNSVQHSHPLSYRNKNFSLWSCCNISGTDTPFMSVWKSFQPVMARQDVFLFARENEEAAYSAWRKLVEFINETRNEEGTKLAFPPTDAISQKHCLYSVNHLRTRDIKKENFLLKIPCGLVLDSSITLIGVPQGLSGEFRLELIGGEEVNPPIILHYNVRLQGDRVTNASVIVQNTWTAEHDWGDEVRCPSKHASESKKVDGLELCASPVGKPPGKRNASRSQIGSGESRHEAEEKVWFPFSRGLPFAATLWVGWEGFHMTIDGKHVSSFEYRQNLEPWMVTGVKLTGDLKLNSIMATGLPVREDASHLHDLEHLKAPGISSNSTTVKMFIAVVSTANNFYRRQAQRRSWMQYQAVRSGAVAVRFFVGLDKNEQVNIELWKEALLYGDVQFLPFIDYYHLITLKSVAMCIYATQNFKADFIMKTDDDTFVRVDEVLSRVSKHTGSLLYGYITYNDLPHRERDNKWYVSEKEWPHAVYPPWAHGPGYIISKDIAQFIVSISSTKRLKLFKLEDVAMGVWIEAFIREGHDVHYVHDDQFCVVGCERGFVIAHYQAPRQMLCLWQQLQRGSGPICCE